ncbi:MAG: mycofactocin precursor MftA [Acidimicrobiales bacterium]
MTVSEAETVATPVEMPAPDEAGTAGGVTTAGETACELLVSDELLVEDISIDGMCGVY